MEFLERGQIKDLHSAHTSNTEKKSIAHARDQVWSIQVPDR